MEGCAEKARLNALDQNPNVRLITYPMLSGTGFYENVDHQAAAPIEIHNQLQNIALEAWDKIRPQGSSYGSWAKVLQKANEPYVEFIARLQNVIEKTVVGKDLQQHLLRLLAFKNVNEECKKALLPIKDTRTIDNFIKQCKDLTSETRKMQLFAETMVTTWNNLQSKKEQSIKCFGCGQTGHVKRAYPKLSGDNQGKKSKAPGLCPKCHKVCHWAPKCRSEQINSAKHEENGKPGLTPGPGQINGGNPPCSLYNLPPITAPQWTYQP